jgi:hypothetical protein
MHISNSKEGSDFWEAYRACAEENRVPPDRLPFYVNWAKNFANLLPGKSLKERTGKDIEAFLADLRERCVTVDWQVRQAEHALKICNSLLSIPQRILWRKLPRASSFGFLTMVKHY